MSNLKNPGKKIAAFVAPGPTITDMDVAYDALLFSVMPGEEYANALGAILFGQHGPSGKLTFTMPNRDNEQNFEQHQYPGDDGNQNVTYSEQHHFGYRYYDHNNVEPKYAFGHGLSYTVFEFANLKSDG